MAPLPSATATWHSDTYPSISPSRPELSIEGKLVLITGAGSGIGAASARAFAEAGASRIALLGRRKQPLLDTKASIEEKYPDVDVFVASADVSVKEQVDAAFKAFVNGAQLDIVVSNAAVEGPKQPVEEVNVDEFGKAVYMNIYGALLVAQAFLRHAAQDAVAIETNSAAAHFEFGQYNSYGVSKAAVCKLWDAVAFSKPGIRVYHTQPGNVDTEMNKRVGGVAAMGFADEVALPAHFNVWLASSEASFLKGKFLYANWDIDELKGRKDEIEGSNLLTINLVGWPFGDNTIPDINFK